MNSILLKAVLFVIVSLSYACQTTAPSSPEKNQEFSTGHLNKSAVMPSDNQVPDLLKTTPALPTPKQVQEAPRHTVIVHKVPVEELLFSLARDTKLNLDIDEDVSGFVTLNAVDQPLDAILNRIVRSNNLIYEIKNQVLRVQKDKPFLRNYRIDYINLSRTAASNVTVATQISSTGQGAGADNSSGIGNNSSTEVSNQSTHEFWSTLENNIASIIYQKPENSHDPKSASEEAETASNTAPSNDNERNPDIILNRESGILGVRATRKNHQEIERFLNEVLYATHRQVLIEATIAEVKLSDSYQAGVDWQALISKSGDTLRLNQNLTDITLATPPSFTLAFDQQNANGESILSTLSALETFGDVKIMSSPKVMALNNQTALLKVVDNLIYFTVEVNIETSSSDNNNNSAGFVTYETEVNTVPVGFVMSVTPYISENDSVTLNVRPTISRVIRQARDPNPALADVGVISEIPVIQVREVESILKVSSGDIAVMGGLMQDEVDEQKTGVPFLSKIPFLGPLFRYDNTRTQKTELVIFIRPTVIKQASLKTDLSSFSTFLPE